MNLKRKKKIKLHRFAAFFGVKQSKKFIPQIVLFTKLLSFAFNFALENVNHSARKSVDSDPHRLHTKSNANSKAKFDKVNEFNCDPFYHKLFRCIFTKISNDKWNANLERMAKLRHISAVTTCKINFQV